MDVSFIVLQILAAHRTCIIESFRVTWFEVFFEGLFSDA